MPVRAMILASLIHLAPSLAADSAPEQAPTGDDPRAAVALGRMLFFDTNLSEPRGQSCATCHDPEHAFIDGRDNGIAGALSLGADGRSLGDRNAPTLTYAAFVPTLQPSGSEPMGGLFLDGRAATLADQAREPFLNPLEMSQPGEEALAARVLENPAYRDAITRHYGEKASTTPAATVDAVTAAIAAYERSAEFSTFDSRFDRYLQGEYEMTREEDIGRKIFFSDLVNCIRCHLNDPGRVSPRETFTNHRYHNIGVPVNEAARRANGLGSAHVDSGLGASRALSKPERHTHAGRFRVPTLRNVAVTAPYMHNGVFKHLETAVAFYARYPLPSGLSNTNPETGRPWRPAEVPDTIDLEILGAGQPIDAERMRYLVAFLKTLTDARYEHLVTP